MATKPFDSTIVSTSEQALDFIGNVLDSSTESSITVKDLTGRILLWNEASGDCAVKSWGNGRRGGASCDLD